MGCILPEYRLTEENIRYLWSNCVFVLDTNVLLNAYRYSPKLRNGLIDTLTKISDRIWIPYQVIMEYYENKPSVISGEINNYENIKKIIPEAKTAIEDQIKKNNLLRKHSACAEITKTLQDKLEQRFKEIDTDLQDIIKKYPTRDDFESFNDIIIKLLDGKVGKPYSVEKLEQISQEGSTRCKLRLPPGYEDIKDKDKHGIRKYGDIIIWFQIIDFAKENKKPIIFISEDLKEDWWWSPSKSTLGPRPELIQEFKSRTDTIFYMYSMDQFMKYANKYIETNIASDIIELAKEFRVEEEKLKMTANKGITLTPEASFELLIAVSQSPELTDVVKRQIKGEKIDPTEILKALASTSPEIAAKVIKIMAGNQTVSDGEIL